MVNLARPKAKLESLMVGNVCTIMRGVDESTGVLDESTGAIIKSSGTTVYTGKFLLVNTGIGSVEGVAGQPVQVEGSRTSKVHLPLSAPIIEEHDILTVVSCANDPQMAGRVFRVVGVRYPTFAVSRELDVESQR